VGTSVMFLYGHFGAGPICACMKVDDCCDQSSIGILTHAKSIKCVHECIFATDYA
jgi:hypothetical protein